VHVCVASPPPSIPDFYFINFALKRPVVTSRPGAKGKVRAIAATRVSVVNAVVSLDTVHVKVNETVVEIQLEMSPGSACPYARINIGMRPTTPIADEVFPIAIPKAYRKFIVQINNDFVIRVP
jgi:hypothetical protein